MRDAPLDLPLRARSKQKKKRRRRKNTTRRAPRPRRTSFFRSLVVADDFLMMRVFFILRVVARIRRCALKTTLFVFINTKKLLTHIKKQGRKKRGKEATLIDSHVILLILIIKAPPHKGEEKIGKEERVFVVFLFFTSRFIQSIISLLDSINCVIIIGLQNVATLLLFIPFVAEKKKKKKKKTSSSSRRARTKTTANTKRGRTRG